MEDEEEEEVELEPGCCTAFWDPEVACFQVGRELNVNGLKFKVFAGIFMVLGLFSLALHKVSVINSVTLK